MTVFGCTARPTALPGQKLVSARYPPVRKVEVVVVAKNQRRAPKPQSPKPETGSGFVVSSAIRWRFLVGLGFKAFVFSAALEVQSAEFRNLRLRLQGLGFRNFRFSNRSTLSFLVHNFPFLSWGRPAPRPR